MFFIQQSHISCMALIDYTSPLNVRACIFLYWGVMVIMFLSARRLVYLLRVGYHIVVYVININILELHSCSCQ